MKAFSFIQLSDSVLRSICAEGSEIKERAIQSFPPDFPRELSGKEEEVSNLLNLLYAWTLMDGRIENAEFTWQVRNKEDDGTGIECSVAIRPSGAFSPEEISLKGLTENPAFRHLLGLLGGRAEEETPLSIRFLIRLKETKAASPIELDSMLAFVGDLGLCGTLIEGFLEEVPALLTGIEAAFRRKEPLTVHRLAHTIKGGAMNIHAPALRQAALRLEQEAKSLHLANARLHIEKIRKEFLTVSEYYAIFVKERM